MGWLRRVRLGVLCLILLVVIDYLWLSLFAAEFYRSHIGQVAGNFAVKVFPVVAAYVLLSLGIVFFVHPQTFDSPRLGFFYGFIYGAVVYGVYNLTNYAVFANWSLSLVFFDMGWGAVLCGLASSIGIRISNYLD